MKHQTFLLTVSSKSVLSQNHSLRNMRLIILACFFICATITNQAYAVSPSVTWTINSGGGDLKVPLGGFINVDSYISTNGFTSTSVYDVKIMLKRSDGQEFELFQKQTYLSDGIYIINDVDFRIEDAGVFNSFYTTGEVYAQVKLASGTGDVTKSTPAVNVSRITSGGGTNPPGGGTNPPGGGNCPTLAAPTNFAASVTRGHDISIRLMWQDNSSGEESFNIQRKKALSNSNDLTFDALPNTSQKIDDEGLVTDQVYSYTIQAQYQNCYSFTVGPLLATTGCPGSITSTYARHAAGKVQVNSSIVTTDFVLDEHASTLMTAGSSIRLTPGTTIKSGAQFIARIAPCGSYEGPRADLGAKQAGQTDALLVDLTSSDDTAISAFPNPTDGNVTLQLNFSIEEGGQLTVLDAFSRQVHFQNINAGEREANLDFRSLPAGTYYVTAVRGGEHHQYKILKK